MRHHAGCPCARFTDFSFTRAKELVSQIEAIVRAALPSWLVLPSVVWQDDADVEASAACHASFQTQTQTQSQSPTSTLLLAKGSCVNWVTTLVACVHAFAHAIEQRVEEDATQEQKQEQKDPRHGVRWRRAVDWITSYLIRPETETGTGLDKRRYACIREALYVLKKLPWSTELHLSIPAFLAEYDTVCPFHPSFPLAYAMDDGIEQRRLEASRGETRWRFQDEFETIETAMQRDGQVEQGSVVELALQLKRDHDPSCKCGSHEAYAPHEAKDLVELLVDEVFPYHLPVFFADPPRVICVLSTKPTKGEIDGKKNAFRVHLNRLDTYADVVRVIIREWARRFVDQHYGVQYHRHDVQSSEKYRRAVAGFASLMIIHFPFDGLLRNWFASRDCLRLALIPAPVWTNPLVQLTRLNRQGALKVLRERTFDDLTPDDLDETRQRAITVKENAMHARLEDTTDFRDYLDFVTVRGPVVEAAFQPYRHATTCDFRVRSVTLDVVRGMSFPGNATVIEMIDQVVYFVSRKAHVPDDPTLYEVQFNGELVDGSEIAADVAEVGLEIHVEPIVRQVQVLKGWSSDVVLATGLPSTIKAQELLELVDVEDPTMACLVQSGCHVLSPVDTVDTTAPLRAFAKGYVQLQASIIIDRRVIRDAIIVDVGDVDKPLETCLARWRWTYGIKGEVECEGSVVTSETTTIRELVATAHDVDSTGEVGEGDAPPPPLRVEPIDTPTEQDVPVHAIHVWDSKGKRLRDVKLKGYHTLQKGFQMLCKNAGILPQTAQLTTLDGRYCINPRQTIYGLGSSLGLGWGEKSDAKDEREPCVELVLRRKALPSKPSRQIIKKRHEAGSPTSSHWEAHDGTRAKKRRSRGKFTHPRPDVRCIVISSSSESESEADSRGVDAAN